MVYRELTPLPYGAPVTAGGAGQVVARFAVQSSRGRAKSIVAFIAIFSLLALCSQWCVRAVATVAHLASAAQERPAEASLAVVSAQNAFLQARNARLSGSGPSASAASLADLASEIADAEASMLGELASAERQTSSPDAQALIASIRLSLKRWRDEQPLPEAYGAFAEALEAARAAEIDRQFALLADAVALDASFSDNSVRAEFEKTRNQAFLWAAGAPAAAIILLLTMMRGASTPPESCKSPGVIILDADGRIVRADDAAAACIAKSRAGGFRKSDLLEALESAVFAFRNGHSQGESLIAGLENGDEIETGDGRSMRVSRHGAEDGGAIVVITEQRPFPPAAVPAGS